MVDVQNEIESIRDFVKPELAGVKFQLQHMKSEFKENELNIKFVKGTTETETTSHYRLNRIYQLTYFGTDELDCLIKMQAIESKTNNNFKFLLNGTTQYLNIESFSFSQPIKTESGIYAVIGILNANYRELRPQPTYDKINNITVKINNL